MQLPLRMLISPENRHLDIEILGAKSIGFSVANNMLRSGASIESAVKNISVTRSLTSLLASASDSGRAGLAAAGAVGTGRAGTSMVSGHDLR